MPLWGNTDDAANSVGYAVNQFKKTANSTNKTAFYGNTSAWYASNRGVAGQFFVDSTEARVTNGPIAIARLSNNGSGYTANATVTISGGGGSGATINAASNSTGRISVLNIQNGGNTFTTNPTITIEAPASTSFNGNSAVNGANVAVNASSGVNATANTIILGGSYGAAYAVGDKVSYAKAASNTVISGLTANTEYFISFANTTDIALTATSGGANIDLTAGSSETGHYFTGPLNFITVTSAGKFIANDTLTYANGAGVSAIGGLTSGTTYYVDTANSTAISLKDGPGGTRIALTKGAASTNNTITGTTATGYVAIGGAENKGATAGWNIRTAGTGGRAGRVQYECLVAMKRTAAAAGDGSDDTILPDATS